MDKTDQIILKTLSKDARATLKDLAKACNLSTVAVHQRLKKLEESETIKGYQIELDYSKLGYTTMVFVGVFLERSSLYREVLKKLKKIPEVLECHFTTGNYSLLIKIICKDNQDLMHVLNEKVQGIKGISRTETFIVLENGIKRGFSF